MNLLDLMKKHRISTIDLSKLLDVNVSQIYKWNREGISINCKHYLKLKQILPELEPKEVLLTKSGKEDGRYRAGRKRKNKIETDEQTMTTENPHKSVLFPTIHLNNKTT